jgi:hypothetical protein
MWVRRVGWLLLLLFVLTAPVLAETLPKRLEEIPIYPGAVRDKDLEKEYLDYVYHTDRVVFHDYRAYRVETIIDDVAGFYLGYLEPELGWPEEDPYGLGPGQSMGPWYEPDFYWPDLFEDQYEYNTLIRDGKWIRSAFEKRPQWEDGKWLAQMWFEWVVVEGGNIITNSILVQDEGWDWRARVDFRATRICFETTVVEGYGVDDWGFGWDDDWDDWDDDWDEGWLWDDDDDLGWDMGRNLYLDPPSEELLDIPFFPGMVYSEELSQGMFTEDYRYYVFFSPAPIDQVVTFYERTLGKTPLSTEHGYLFALKGKLPIPDEGLAIQPNEVFVGYPETMITVQLQVEE